MRIQDLIENILTGSQSLGTFTLPDLLRFAGDGSVSGLAVAKETEYELCLALIRGEPEGAIYIDGKGELYGDKALIRITGHEKFVLCDIKPDIVDAVVMGCRIFEKTHLGKSIAYVLPEIGKKSSGIGLLSLTVLRGQGTPERAAGLDTEGRPDCRQRYHHAGWQRRLQGHVRRVRLHRPGPQPGDHFIPYHVR